MGSDKRMNYQDFLSSLQQNRIHFLNKSWPGELTSGELRVDQPHYFISTSGTNFQKHYLFSLEALEQSSKIVIDKYKIESKDKWLLTLSTQHIGGFSIFVRSYFAGMFPPVSMSWKPQDLISTIESQKITLLSLVPTQVFDLVSYQLQAPSSVRCVFVGGAALSEDLFEKAQRLGWSLKPCFGMTETAAQMASKNKTGFYEPYPSWSIKKSEKGFLEISGPGLFSYEYLDGRYLPSESKWFTTSDKVEIKENGFSFLGREEQLLKQKGAYLDFNAVKKDFESLLLKNKLSPSNFALLVLEDQRAETKIFIVTDLKMAVKNVFAGLRSLEGVFYIEKLPRTDLSKLKIKDLEQLLGAQILSH